MLSALAAPAPAPAPGTIVIADDADAAVVVPADRLIRAVLVVLALLAGAVETVGAVEGAMAGKSCSEKPGGGGGRVGVEVG